MYSLQGSLLLCECRSCTDEPFTLCGGPDSLGASATRFEGGMAAERGFFSTNQLTFCSEVRHGRQQSTNRRDSCFAYPAGAGCDSSSSLSWSAPSFGAGRRPNDCRQQRLHIRRTMWTM